MSSTEYTDSPGPCPLSWGWEGKEWGAGQPLHPSPQALLEPEASQGIISKFPSPDSFEQIISQNYCPPGVQKLAEPPK